MNTLSASQDAEVVAEHPTRNRLLAAILAMLVLHAFASAAVLVVPLLAALLLSLMLSPMVRLLCNWRLPRAIAVSLVLLAAIAVTASLLLSLIGPARTWMDKMPTSMTRIERTLDSWRSPLRQVSAASAQLEKLTDIDKESRVQRVVEAGPSQMAKMLHATPAALSSLIATLILIFVFLLKGDALLRKLVELAPALRLKKDIVLATRSAQHELSSYIITVAMVNGVLGLVLALVLWSMGVADPVLWGGVAAILNFVPFVGPMLMVLILTVVGFGQFNALMPALLVPATFVALHALEELITPQILGHRLALDLVVVFLALMLCGWLCGWLWGPAGLLLATPLLTCLRIVAERIPSWRPLAKLLRP